MDSDRQDQMDYHSMKQVNSDRVVHKMCYHSAKQDVGSTVRMKRTDLDGVRHC